MRLRPANDISFTDGTLIRQRTINHSSMKTIIHVNQHNIKANSKGAELPVITCKTYKENRYASEVLILDKDGQECAKIVYSPDNPLSCGARVWIETSNEIKIIR
jgi:hypothetical protein